MSTQEAHSHALADMAHRIPVSVYVARCIPDVQPGNIVLSSVKHLLESALIQDHRPAQTDGSYLEWLCADLELEGARADVGRSTRVASSEQKRMGDHSTFHKSQRSRRTGHFCPITF